MFLKLLFQSLCPKIVVIVLGGGNQGSWWDRGPSSRPAATTRRLKGVSGNPEGRKLLDVAHTAYRAATCGGFVGLPWMKVPFLSLLLLPYYGAVYFMTSPHTGTTRPFTYP